NQLPLRAQDAADVLVGGRRFLAQAACEPVIEPDAAQLSRHSLHAYDASSLGPAHAPAGAVRARAQSVGVPPTLDVDAACPHRARNDPDLAVGRWNRALAMNPEALSAVGPETDVVVIAGDMRSRVGRDPEDARDDMDHGSYHRPPTCFRVVE